jgi:hypothetical protein
LLLGLGVDVGAREPEDGPGPDLGVGVISWRNFVDTDLRVGEMVDADVGVGLGVEEGGTSRSLKRHRVPARLWLQHGIAMNGDLLR